MRKTASTQCRLIPPTVVADYLGIGEDFARRLMNANAIRSVDLYQNKRDLRTTREQCDSWLEAAFDNPDFAPPFANAPNLVFESRTSENAKNRVEVGRQTRGSRKSNNPKNL